MEIVKKFQQGDLIIKEGDVSTSAYIIRSGSVGVYKSAKNILLSTLKQGDVFGEMGLIEDRLRSASVIALSDTETIEISRESFNSLLKEKPEVLLPLIRVLFDRLRQMDHLITVYAQQQKIMEVAAQRPVAILVGKSKLAKKVLQDRDLVLTKLPFNVGRQAEAEDETDDVFSVNDLYLPDRPPFNVSRNHFAIIERNGKYFILDRKSRLGTLVNDTIIGGESKLNLISLDYDTNEIVVGSRRSPYVFQVQLQKIETKEVS